MHTRGFQLFWIACCVVGAGCRTDARRAPEAVRRDSAGIIILENAAARMRAALTWAIDSVPDLNIGTAEGDEHYQLFRVSGTAQLADGRVLVVNAGSQELRFFDTNGVFLSQVGGRGQGPEEYEYPELVPTLQYDTIWIYDRPRISLLDGHGRMLERIAPRNRFLPPFMVGVWAGRLITSQGSARVRPDSPEGMVANDITYEAIDIRTEVRDTIAQVQGRGLFVWNLGTSFGFTMVPFDIGPSAAVGRDRLYVTPADAAEVRAVDAAGTVREIFRILQPAQPVPPAAFDSVVAAEVATARDQAGAAELRRRYGKMPRPSVMPVFQSLLVDAHGNLWLESFRTHEDAPPEWVVIDPSGTVLGRITTPARVTLAQIGEHYILGLTRDDADVEHVVRYRLRRQ
jgi:hypothetical protein